MKKRMAWLLSAILRLAGCSSNSVVVDTSVPKSTSTSVTTENSTNSAEQTQVTQPLHLLHSTRNGVAANGYKNDGMYLQRARNDGSPATNLVFLDYVQKKEMVVCARPECIHADETCTGWFAPEIGPVMLCVVENALYGLSLGSEGDTKDTPPQLFRADLSGANRRVLTSFDTKSNFFAPFVTDGESLYFIEQTYTQESRDSPVQSLSNLIQISLANGAAKTIRTWSKDVRIWGAEKNCFYIQVHLNYDYNGVDIMSPGQGQQYEIEQVFTDGTSNVAFSIEESGLVGNAFDNAFYSVALDTRDIWRQPLSGGEKVKVGTGFPKQIEPYSIFFWNLYGNQLFLYGALPDTLEERAHPVLYALDLHTQALNPITLCVEQDGIKGTKLVLPLAEYEDTYLVAPQMEMATLSGIDRRTGAVVQYESMTERYALIAKHDFLGNTPNYIEIAPVNIT